MILFPNTGRGIFLWVKNSSSGRIGDISVLFDTNTGTDDAVFDCSS